MEDWCHREFESCKNIVEFIKAEKGLNAIGVRRRRAKRRERL